MRLFVDGEERLFVLRRTISRGLSLGVTFSILMTTVFATAGAGSLAPVVHAAEKALSEEEAIALAKKQLTILGEYKLARVEFVDSIEMLWGKPIWSSSWNKENSGSIELRIDALSGGILKYERRGEERDLDAIQKKLPEDQAIQVATEFLKQVTTEEERSRLSKPNEYPDPYVNYNSTSKGTIINFTRIENEIPFLENGFRFRVGSNGEVIRFERHWTEEELPDTSKVIDIKNAEKKWDKEAILSPMYKDTAEIDQPVYDFKSEDPQIVNAITGEMLDSYGQTVNEKKIRLLGKTVPPSTTEQKIITQDEALKIAEQQIKKLPSTYRWNGRSFESRSVLDRKNWNFEFVSQPRDGSESDTVKIGINNRGYFVEFSMNEKSRFLEERKKIEKSITWAQAQESAEKFLQTFYPDQLGIIYAVDYVPNEKRIKEILENGEPYNIQFGYMIKGIPEEDTIFHVDINPATGEVWQMYNNGLQEYLLPRPSQKNIGIDLNTAKKVMKENKKLMLTYFQPKVDGIYGRKKMLEQPLLVYRYVGEKGLVKADGKWHSYAEKHKQE
ncbi:YcdB/YcdC domain-containing protein [Brevibacillus sp. IT-7CA2]|uniref:YcdB/YcdC domain-containing protein n=1 Tax=Brevibacillus sp. IT-7CA2 TaxID=3026436 RepID=UPI0039DF524B